MKIRSLLGPCTGVLLAFAAHAAAPAAAPAGTTGLCNDGTYYSGAEKKGACRGHKGVKDWYGAAAEAKPATTTQAIGEKAPNVAKQGAATMPGAGAAAALPATAVPTKAAGVAAMPAAATSAKATPVAAPAAPGGGPGSVWVNSETKTYHCMSDRWYGKTKSGEYMSEADAKAKGFHAAHGKACAS
jgi:hypothetical protein